MDQKDEEFLKRLLVLFKIEAQEHLKIIATGLAELEYCNAQQGSAVVERIYREAHSLKGAACSVNWSDIVALCQTMEDVFSALKRGDLFFSLRMKDRLLAATDWLENLIAGAALTPNAKLLGKELVRELEELVNGQAADGAEKSANDRETEKATAYQDAEREAQATLPLSVISAAADDTVRISLSKLDALLLQVEELLVVKMALRQRAVDLREIKKLTELLKKDTCALPERKIGERASGFYLGQLEKKVNQLTKAMEYDSRGTASMVDTLLTDMKQALMLTVGSQLDGFPRFVRELARESGKQAELVIEGREIEIDRRVLEEMKDPLLHLLRNCMVHGIEEPKLRQQRQKPPCGVIQIAVLVKDNRIQINVSDDGGGIDVERVKETAVERGVLSASEAESLSTGDALQLIFHSEISTAPMITDNAGRGLGMAIVREKIEKLNGALQLETQAGKGTTFQLSIPISLAMLRGLVVSERQRFFIFPAGKVARVARIHKEAIRTVENCEMVSLDGRPVALVRLANVLAIETQKQPRQSEEDYIPVVVLHSGGQSLAFGVDEVLQEQEVLAKPLGRQLSRVRNIAGATILGNGKIAPILHVPDLIKSALRNPEACRLQNDAPLKVCKAVLVADDSITARMMLKHILESAGYEVVTAVDGMEAFALLQKQERKIELLISDVNMPKLDGFSLTEKIRHDERFAKLPVVLVTSLEEKSDRERGIDVGADAYIVKSSFEQNHLLEVLERLI